MGTAPAPTVEDVLKFYRVQLSSNLVHKAGFSNKVHKLHLWVYKAFNMTNICILVWFEFENFPHFSSGEFWKVIKTVDSRIFKNVLN
jgi:hypothetical protein